MLPIRRIRVLPSDEQLELNLDGKVVKTPHLQWAYAPRDFNAYREMGATWKIITDDVPQPKGIEPVGINASNRK